MSISVPPASSDARMAAMDSASSGAAPHPAADRPGSSPIAEATDTRPADFALINCCPLMRDCPLPAAIARMRAPVASSVTSVFQMMAPQDAQDRPCLVRCRWPRQSWSGSTRIRAGVSDTNERLRL